MKPAKMTDQHQLIHQAGPELQAIQAILTDLRTGDVDQAVQNLQALRETIHAAIPAKLRIGRGITWVVQRISDLLAEGCPDAAEFISLAKLLSRCISDSDLLFGVPIFMMGEVGKRQPEAVFGFFARAADSQDWVVREFAQGGFRELIGEQREAVLPWLKQMALDKSPNRRRFAAETLRPVTVSRWMFRQPEYSLGVLRLMFHEAHPYPRTSVGNNLSDLSRRQPELIFNIVQELVATQDKNSYWIAERACRNLVKQAPLRVMDILGVDEYHYKDRNFYRSQLS